MLGLATFGEQEASGISPYDTAASSGLRFIIELVAWIAGPWAVADLTGSAWTALPALVVLIGLPAAFNTPGDKRVTGIATPGPARIAIEALLTAAAIIGSWIAWPAWAAATVTVLSVAMIITGMRRYQWLAAGAPPGPHPRTP